MNERIEKLAKRAECGFETIDLQWITPANLKKFAELIVEECLDLVSYGGEFCSRPKLVEKIKEHFGVEE